MSQLTQSEINDLLQQFIGKYANQKPGYYGFEGECLSLAKLWFDTVRNNHLNGPMLAPPTPGGVNGSGSDYWVSPPGSVAELFDKQNYDPNAIYPQGSLFVNTATHHIGIMLDNHPGQTQAYVFQQNADPDGSPAHTGMRNKFDSRGNHRIDGILVIKAQTEQPPQPARTPKDYMQYTAIPPKTMRANKLTTNWYNLNNDTDDINNFQVANTLTVNTPFPIGGFAHNLHFPQYTYAMSPEDFNRALNGDYSTNNGINIADLEEIPPAPYTPPAAPVQVPTVTYYEVVTTLMYFKTAIDAKRHENAVGTLNKGRYIDLKTEDNVKCVVRKNTDNDNLWINTSDNKLDTPLAETTAVQLQPAVNVITLPVDPPKIVNEPVDIPSQIIVPAPQPKEPIQWGWINDNHQPSVFQYQGNVNMQVRDIEGSNPPITMTPGTKKIVSRYTLIGNKSYLLPDKEFTAGKAYGIEEDRQMVEIKKPTVINDIIGDLSSWGEFLETGFKSASRLITDISPVKISHAGTRIKQTIDGYNSKRKVK